MSNSNSNINTNTSTRTKMILGLSAIATAMFASSAFAEPPIQPSDTLESLSKATVQTTINGQPGSLEQMSIPKQVISQAIAQNAVIDLQARTLRPMNAPVSASTQVAQNVESMDDNVESELSANAGEISESEQSAMTEAQNQLAQAQLTTEQASMQTAELNAAVDTAINEADQTVASAQVDVQNGMDQNAAALMPEADQNAIDPIAQAVPAEDMSQTEDARQLAEPEMDATTPLQ